MGLALEALRSGRPTLQTAFFSEGEGLRLSSSGLIPPLALIPLPSFPAELCVRGWHTSFSEKPLLCLLCHVVIGRDNPLVV